MLLLGLAKGGFAGIGILAVPLLSLVISPVQAAAITLPILIAQDVVSVWVFRNQWKLDLVAVLTAGSIVGVALGYLFAASVSTAGVELILGVITAGFGAQRLWIERGGAAAATPSNAPVLVDRAIGLVLGAVAGFTSQIAHAGGPPAQMYLLPKNLGRDVFLSTSTLFFAILNWIKAPAYVALGQLTPNNLVIAGALLPLAVIATLIGARVVRSLASARFYRIMYWLMILLGAKLAWDGASVLFF